jgi:hypothetical protein
LICQARLQWPGCIGSGSSRYACMSAAGREKRRRYSRRPIKRLIGFGAPPIAMIPAARIPELFAIAHVTETIKCSCDTGFHEVHTPTMRSIIWCRCAWAALMMTTIFGRSIVARLNQRGTLRRRTDLRRGYAKWFAPVRSVLTMRRLRLGRTGWRRTSDLSGHVPCDALISRRQGIYPPVHLPSL